jgi:phage gpG-like protein
MSIAIKVSGGPSLAAASAQLAELEAKARNPASGLKTIGEKLLRVQLDRFRDQSAPDGSPWQPLRPLTIETRGGKTGPILRRSGLLMRSSNYRVAGRTLSIGISGVQAGVQQFGATIVPKKAKRLAIPIPAAKGARPMVGFAYAMKVTIPARPMVGFGPKDQRAVEQGVRAWLAVDAKP